MTKCRRAEVAAAVDDDDGEGEKRSADTRAWQGPRRNTAPNLGIGQGRCAVRQG